MILVDTHVIVWLAFSPEKISPAAAALIRRAISARGDLGLSVITVYEVANAIRRGRIQPLVPEQIFMERIKMGFKVFPISETIATCAAKLPEKFPGDPMDRMIAATAIVEQCTLITADRRIRAANACKTLW